MSPLGHEGLHAHASDGNKPWQKKPAPIWHQPSRLTAPDHTLGLSLWYTQTQAWSCLPPTVHHAGDWRLPVCLWEKCRIPVHGPGWLSLTYIQTFKATRKLLSFIFAFSPECGSLINTESETTSGLNQRRLFRPLISFHQLSLSWLVHKHVCPYIHTHTQPYTNMLRTILSGKTTGKFLWSSLHCFFSKFSRVFPL